MTSQEPQSKPTRRPRRRLAPIRWTLYLVVFLATFVGAVLIWAQGRTVAAPEWLHTVLENQLNAALTDATLEVGQAVLVVEDIWRPRFVARDLKLYALSGQELVSFSEVRGGLDLAALRERRFALQSVEISGVFVTLRRSKESGFALFTGEQGSSNATRRASTVTELITDLDDILLRPFLASLTQLDVRAVTLRYEDERANRAWTVDGGRMRLNRNGNDVQLAVDLAVLGGGAQVATLEMNYGGVIGELNADIGVTFADLPARDIASQATAFSWLRALDAPISGSVRGAVTADGTLAPVNATLQIGSGVIKPQSEASAIPIKGARSYFTYLPKEKVLTFDELFVDTAWGSGLLEGRADIGSMQNGQIDELIGQFRISDMRINPVGFYDMPVLLEAADMDFRLRLSPFSFQLGRLEVIDRGEVLSVRGGFEIGPEGWELALDGEMDGLAPDRLLELWPENIGFKTRRWISENVFAARLHDITGAMRMVQGGDRDVFLGFDFDELDVRFLKTMPRIRDGRGHASLIGTRFVAVLDEGGVEAPQGGYVDGAGTSFIVPDITVKPNRPGLVRLKARSSITAALSMLDQPPLRMMQKANRPVDIAEGKVQVQGTISMPLKKKPPPTEIFYDITGTITEMRSDQLVKDRVLEAASVDLVASDEGVRLAGEGTLEGVPLDIVWSKQLGLGATKGKSQVRGTTDINTETLEAFGIRLPPGTLSGTAPGDVTVDLAKGEPPRLVVTSDLLGARLAVPQVNWRKAEDTGATLEVLARLGDAPVVDRFRLEAPGLAATGNITLTPERQLDRFSIENLRVGNWLNGPVDLVGRGPGRPVGVVLRGGSLDLRRAALGGNSGGQGGPLTVRLDRLQVSDTIAITAMSGQFSTTGGLSGNFEGSINGAARISGQLVPQGARSAIRLTSEDAGSVFASSGVTRQARGGQMALVLTPVGSEGAFDGDLRVTDTRIKDAPAIAALLNAISIVGLINELNGDGIFFSDIKADFRLSPSQITLREASATGTSMGLSMDGVFKPDTGEIQMQGVISPVYLLNAIGSVLTREGEGLFGFNYSISGTAQDPTVFVNPLTALAPAMFRNLFRRSAPEVPLVDGETPPPPPPPKPTLEQRREDR